MNALYWTLIVAILVGIAAVSFTLGVKRMYNWAHAPHAPSVVDCGRDYDDVRCQLLYLEDVYLCVLKDTRHEPSEGSGQIQTLLMHVRRSAQR